MPDGKRYIVQVAAAIRCIALLAVTICHHFDGASRLTDLLLLGGVVYALLTTFHPQGRRLGFFLAATVVLDVAYISALIGVTGHSEYMLLYYLPILLATMQLRLRAAVAASMLATAGLVLVVGMRGDTLTFTGSPMMQVYLFAGSALVLAGCFFALRSATTRQSETARRLEEALQRLSAMHEVARSGHGPDGLRKLAHTTAKQATELVGADYGYLALADPGGGLSVQAVHMERRPESHIAFDPHVAHHSVVNRAPVAKSVHWDGKGDFTVVAVPLIVGGHPIGVLEVIRHSARSLRSREVELLRALCSEASATIEAARLRDEAYTLAAVDQTTGLYINEEFRRLASEVLREAGNRPMAIVAFDLDGSTETSSRYGQEACDEQLTVFADVIRRGVRDHDLAGRLGPDEFAVLLVDCNEDGARSAAARLRGAFSRRAFHFPQGEGPVTATVCAGIAATVPDEVLEEPLALLNRAESALTAAKQQGPNQIAAWAAEASGVSGQLGRLLRSSPQDSTWK